MVTQPLVASLRASVPLRPSRALSSTTAGARRYSSTPSPSPSSTPGSHDQAENETAQDGISRDMADEAESSASGSGSIAGSKSSGKMGEESVPRARQLSTPTNEAEIESLWSDVLNRPDQINALRRPRSSTMRRPMQRDFLARAPAPPRFGSPRMRFGETQAVTKGMLEALSTTFRTVPTSPARLEGRTRSGAPDPGLGIGVPMAHSAWSGVGQGVGWGVGSGMTPSWIRDRKRREEESDPELVALEEELSEDLNLIQTDAELVNWARRRIFTPLPTPTPTDPSASESTTTSKSSSASESTTTSESSSVDPPVITYPRTYPRMLAQLIRTARKSFRNPHLALAFFQHARSLSLESYLSGCLTSAYNEYLKTSWESFRDLEAVDAGVREMAAAGVVWDKSTREIVERVARQVSEEIDGRVGDGCGYRWGEGVYEVLSRLDGLVHRDIRREESRFNRVTGEKRRHRAALRREEKNGRARDAALWM